MHVRNKKYTQYIKIKYDIKYIQYKHFNKFVNHNLYSI